MNNTVSIETITITHTENHLSFAEKCLGKKNLKIVANKNNIGYELQIIQMAKEDGSGNNFLFKANLVSLTNNGQKMQVPEENTRYIGFLNILKNSGHIQFHPKSFTW